MKKSMAIIFSFLMLVTSYSFAVHFDDYDFEQERMKLTPEAIYIVSCFDSEDHLTAYTYYGVRLWDDPFFAKILSWEIVDDMVIVFSKDPSGHRTYLTCINRINGQMIWQRP